MEKSNYYLFIRGCTIVAHKGLDWFEQKFLHILTPITIIALLLTLTLLFSFKGNVIIENPLTILWIAIPLALQTILIFSITYIAEKWWGVFL
jgi:ACR3 family arsenite transporter